MRIAIFADELGLDVFERTALPGRDVCAIVSVKDRKAAVIKGKALSCKYGVPHITHCHKKDKKDFDVFMRALKSADPDIILVNSYSMILPEEVLEIPRLGCFNVHGGILPSYRGTNIINWVLINGEKEAGVTLHKMTKAIDSGPVLFIEKIDIDIEDTVLSLREKLKKLSEMVIKKAIPLFEEGKFILNPQNETNARYWPKRKPEDGLFSWDWDEERIYNMIRALVDPWPGAFTCINGKKTVYSKFLTIEEIRKLKNEYASSCSPA